MGVVGDDRIYEVQTLHLETLNPEPIYEVQTLNPETLNPELQTLNPKPKP